MHKRPRPISFPRDDYNNIIVISFLFRRKTRPAEFNAAEDVCI